MILVEAPLAAPAAAHESLIPVEADRRTLATRRWRGVAADGTEFGFDLQESLHPGVVIYRKEGICYVLSQSPEAVLEIAALPDLQASMSLAWQIGNLHFPLQIHAHGARTIDDPAIRQMLDRAGIHYHAEIACFEPLVAARHSHHHASHGH